MDTILAKMVVGYLGAVLVVFSFDFAYTHFAPMSNWIEYHSVEPTRTSFDPGQLVTFQSERSIRRPVAVEFLDILHCDIQGQEVYTSVYKSAAYNQEIGHDIAVWSYGGFLPDRPVECYLESNVTAALDYGVRKTQIITGNKFLLNI